MGDTIAWPESVQRRLRARETLLGLFHARVAKAAMFVDDILVAGIKDPAKILPNASKRILQTKLSEEMGYNTEVKNYRRAVKLPNISD